MWKKEVESYFSSPLAYVLIGLFSLISGIIFFNLLLTYTDGVQAMAGATEQQFSFVEEVVYKTIPDGDVLRRVRKTPFQKCKIQINGCNYCDYGDNEDEYYLGGCTMAYCPDDHENFCRNYRCSAEEISVQYTADGPTESPTNKICGTSLNVTVAGCYCKPEYQFRDKGSLKCVKSCL